MQRFLDPEGLRSRGLEHFDAWAATFGEVIDTMEISPDGAGLRPRSRFARFTNLPELQTMFRAFADVQTAEMLNLPRRTSTMTEESIFLDALKIPTPAESHHGRTSPIYGRREAMRDDSQPEIGGDLPGDGKRHGPGNRQTCNKTRPFGRIRRVGKTAIRGSRRTTTALSKCGRACC
jgi:hypothetical protein